MLWLMLGCALGSIVTTLWVMQVARRRGL